MGVEGDLSPGAVFPFGELLVDVGATLDVLQFGLLIGGTTNFTTPVPNDTDLLGFKIWYQAYIDNYGGAGQVTNSLELTLGNAP
jgi:hypothetical protein